MKSLACYSFVTQQKTTPENNIGVTMALPAVFYFVQKISVDNCALSHQYSAKR